MITVGIAVPVVGVLIGLVSGPASSQKHWPSWFEFLRTHPWPSLIVLTVVSVGLASVATLKPKEEMDLLEAADQLAAAVGHDWTYEAQWRKIFDPYPLPVNWTPADQDLVVPWPAMARLAASRPGGPQAGATRWATGPAGLAGGDRDLVDVIDRVPTGRLVVLGDKGAGKTILLMRLVLDLLPRRKRGDPVPILLPLASWNPAEQDLQTWMVDWLKTDRAGLAGLAKAGNRMSLARALVEAGLILPVLDGLDEIPDRVRGAAIAKVNDWMKPGQGLVLAARTGDYRAVVHPLDGAPVLLTGAAGIELRPLEIGVVTGYLKDSANETGMSGRWDSVIASFASAHPPPAAQVLTTPLMAALARVAYNPRPGEDPAAIMLHPSELLDDALFPNTKAIEDYLFDRFIPASYRRHPDPMHPSRRYRWRPEQAQRWLVFVAQNLEYRQSGSTDIAWWKLPTAAPKRLAGAVLGIVAGIAFALGYPFLGIGIGLTVGILAGLGVRRWLRTGREGLGLGMAGGVIGGALGGFVALVVLGPGSTNLLVRLLPGGLAVGIAMSLMNGFVPSLVAGFAGQITIAFYENHPAFEGIRSSIGSGYHLINALGAWLTALLFVELVGRSVPARGIRWSPTWFVSGLICSFVTGVVAWIQVGPFAGLAVGLAGTVASGLVAGVAESVATDLAGAANPPTVLRRDRTAFLVSWLGLGVALGSAIGLGQALTLDPAGHPQGFWHGARIGVTTFVAVGLVFGFIQAMWGPFAVARWYLAASRRLPWRLMTFLHDAHASRGVLRQVGAVYQFRHVELQRRLAGPSAKAAANRYALPGPGPGLSPDADATAGFPAGAVPTESTGGFGSFGRESELARLAGQEAALVMSKSNNLVGHAFISYVREDSRQVDQLQRTLQAAGIPVWRDTADLWPGEDWRTKIRRAITDNALVFIACFSRSSLARGRSYQNEELTLAIEQLRLRPPDDPWLIPVRLDECEIPDRDIGGGRTLTSIQRADLFGDSSEEGAERLVAAVLRILGRHSDGA